MSVAMKINKKITISATITADNQSVTILSANVSTEGSDKNNFTQTDMNETLYRANRAEIRDQIRAFQDVVWEVQDEIAAEKAAETTEA